ncbi:hypothetical protein O7632_22315 [Solwaraspora sp. WMMD406]|uniref:LolA family protein n=1 Tax=Solwaraspora sp. WMMD406 TaxID=3016095 RepID=UPI00241641A2|nr:hypothetical protein [Solwaraspora sp. WMMD406]MDG4766811.1 hypothetical protein [Solwaraspora sp. WMMD406]
MSVFTSRPAMRWLVPAAAAAVLVGGGAAVGALAASADPVLPPRSAEQLLVDLQSAEVDGMSGTVVHRAELGLPSAINLASQFGGGLASLVDGTNTVRVWYSGPDQARIAVANTLGQTDVIRNGRDVWTWSSQLDKASHHVLPQDTEDAEGRPAPEDLAPEDFVTPQAAADQALAAIDESTEVTVGRAAEIAGRTAYELILTPRDPASLVGEIRIAIDSAEYVPLRFAVYAAGAERAAIETAFTQVSFERPDAEQFVFNPPPGTEVEEGTEFFDDLGSKEKHRPGGVPGGPDAELTEEWAQGRAGEDAVKTVGDGWATVLVVTPPAELAGRSAAEAAESAADAAESADAADLAGALRMLGDLPQVDGDWGSGQVLSSALFTVLFTDDGRILAGAVGPERLYEVAAETR